MGFTEFKNDLLLKADQNKPEIMLVAGLIGVVGATVLACRATLKAKDIIEEKNERLEEIQENLKTVESKEDGSEVSEIVVPAETKKEIRKVYLKTGLQLAKVYAPAIAVETAAFALLIKSNSVQRDRLAGLTAAYITVDQAFKKYREAVVAELGEEKDLEFKNGLKKQKIDAIVEDEDGNELTKKEEGLVLQDGRYISEYAKFFDESCPDWTKSPENNMHFLMLQQAAANEKLKIQGHLFLNEVYDMLGIPRTKAGAVVGWLYPRERFDSLDLNGFVDFGIFNMYKQSRNQAFVNGYERSILLDFNVDGCIYNYI